MQIVEKNIIKKGRFNAFAPDYRSVGLPDHFNNELQKFKSVSSNFVKMKSQYQSVRKVCETIFNNVRGNEGVDTSPLNDWLLEMEETFAQTTSHLENVEQNIQVK